MGKFDATRPDPTEMLPMRNFLPLRSRGTALAAWCVVLWGASATAYGQTGGGMFGSRNMGSSVSAGSRTMSGGSNPGGAGSTTQSQQGVGSITGSERFVRDNRQAGAFVGADGADTSAVGTTGGGAAANGGLFGATGGRGFGNSGFSAIGGNQRGGVGANGRTNQFGMGANGRAGGAQNRGGVNRLTRGGKEYRTQLNIDFEYAPVAVGVLQTNLGKRLANLSEVRQLAGLDVTIEGRTAILVGEVPDEKKRKLVEQLVKLEPGISAVDNRLTIAVPSAPQP